LPSVLWTWPRPATSRAYLMNWRPSSESKAIGVGMAAVPPLRLSPHSPPQSSGDERLTHRQCRALFDRTQCERAPDLGDAGDLGEVHDKALIGAKVGHHDAQEIIA